jgi:hypothetical protein
LKLKTHTTYIKKMFEEMFLKKKKKKKKLNLDVIRTGLLSYIEQMGSRFGDLILAGIFLLAILAAT